MLALIRIITLLLISFFICLLGLIYCLFNPRNPSNVTKLSKWFSYLSYIVGIKVEVRKSNINKKYKNVIYIANHQNNYDMITITHAVQSKTITVGKKSLIWIPIFGQLYWLAGNFFINRSNKISSYNTLDKIIKDINKYNISILMFPEGTRNKSCHLMPFKNGAFYISIFTGIPIIPICVSNTVNKIKLNRWCNGLVIIDILPAIASNNYSRKQLNIFTKHCYNIMSNKIAELNSEVMNRESYNI